MGRKRKSAPTAAALRKRRQIERQRAEGRGLVLLTPSADVMATLGKLAKVTGRGVKGESEAVLRRAIAGAVRELRQLAGTIGPVYREAKAYMPYAEYLRGADASIRVGDRVLRAVDWQPLAQKLGVFADWTRRMGWREGRARVFLEGAAAGTLDL